MNTQKNLAALFVLGLSSAPLHAAITITNLELSKNSLSFTASGTLPEPTAANFNLSIISIQNPNVTASPGFALGFQSPVTSFTETFSQTVSTAPTSGDINIRTGNGQLDYAYIIFTANMAPGEIFSGTLTGNWNFDAFDPTAVTTLDFYWGGFVQAPERNLLQAGVPVTVVPECSAVFMLISGAIPWLMRRTRRRILH